MPVLVFLALLWAAVLVPVVLKAVAARRAYFASSFGDGLQALGHAEGFFGPTDGGELAPRARPAPVDVGPPRRFVGPLNASLLRSILAGLLIAVLVSLLAAVGTSQRAMLGVNLALDNCLLLFVALVVLRRDVRDRALTPARRHQPQPTVAAAPVEIEPRTSPRVYTAGAPVIAAPVVSALSSSVAQTA